MKKIYVKPMVESYDFNVIEDLAVGGGFESIPGDQLPPEDEE